MKGFIVTLLMLLSLPTVAQVQNGYVKSLGRPNAKGAALQGVTIRVKGVHNAVVTAQTGKFSISMTGKKAGDAYALQSVRKTGYELVEAGMIGRNYAFSPSVTMQKSTYWPVPARSWPRSPPWRRSRRSWCLRDRRPPR